MSDWFADVVNGSVYVGSSLPVIGPVLSAIDNARYYSDYMEARGLSWRDVKYPARMGAGSLGSPLSFVSGNIKRLYE